MSIVMTSQLMTILSWLSKSYILMLVAASVLIAVLFWGLLYQKRRKARLNEEIGHILHLCSHNIEYELVLKAMKLSTWKLDVDSGVINFETDFRDIEEEFTYADSIQLQEIAQQVAPWDRDNFNRAFDDLKQGRIDEFHLQYQLRARLNDVFSWSETYATIAKRDETGKPLTIVGTTACINHRKKMEEELIRARNQAEESDRLKSSFLANISHEVHTPLNAIVGFSDILPQIADEEERQKVIAIIKDNNKKLLNIFDDMVRLSKREAMGTAEKVEMEPLNVKLLVDEIFQKYQQMNFNPNVVVKKDVATGEVTVNSNRNMVNTILNHLMDNAFKFTSEGSVTIGTMWREGNVIRFFVRDTGIGVADEDRERIFERFIKVDSFTQGMGLGLSVCRSYAYSIGGSIGLDSHLSQGSTFWLDLPMG